MKLFHSCIQARVDRRAKSAPRKRHDQDKNQDLKPPPHHSSSAARGRGSPFKVVTQLGLTGRIHSPFLNTFQSPPTVLWPGVGGSVGLEKNWPPKSGKRSG